jgi:hypothetical protein
MMNTQTAVRTAAVAQHSCLAGDANVRASITAPSEPNDGSAIFNMVTPSTARVSHQHCGSLPPPRAVGHAAGPYYSLRAAM